MLIDATYGRKTAAVLVMDSDHVVLSALPAEKLLSLIHISNFANVGVKGSYQIWVDLERLP